jgi:catalase
MTEGLHAHFDPVPRMDGISSAGDPLTAVRSDLYLLTGQLRRVRDEE